MFKTLAYMVLKLGMLCTRKRDETTNKLTNEWTNQKQYASHFFKNGGIKMFVTDVVIGKYIEEAQPLKLQSAYMEKKSIFTPQKATTCISEKKFNFGYTSFQLQGR